MMNLEAAINENRKIIVWGTGKCFRENIERIRQVVSIYAVTDSDEVAGDKETFEIPYKTIQEIDEEKYVIIMVENKNALSEISEFLEERDIPYCNKDEVMGYGVMKEEEYYVKAHRNELSVDDSKWDNVMKKYIGLHVPATTCNLACPYCYIRQQKEFYRPPMLLHDPKYIRLCLSQKRLGGQAIIGLCGAGETLLADKFIDLCVELLKEGHFLHIVTNGTLTDKIKELVERAGKYISHIFFKFSFHYEELKRQKKLEVFAENVNYVSNAGASFTVELTTDDNLVKDIDEIKRFSIEKFGALPHITIARDDTKKEIPIYTKLPLEQYYQIWSQFESQLFDVKWKYYGKFISNCYAGKSTLYINLLSGKVMTCLGQPAVANLYNLEKELLEFEVVKDGCVFPYCYNNHAYLTLGVSPEIITYSFAEVRDRERADGSHWVKKEVYDFIDQKLYDTNHYAINEE